MIATIGGEYVVGAILMVIILIAELNTERVRASIKALMGSVPETALVRRPEGNAEVRVAEARPGDVVIVRAGEKLQSRASGARVMHREGTDFTGPMRPDHGRMIWAETGRPGYGLHDRALGATYLYGLWEAISRTT